MTEQIVPRMPNALKHGVFARKLFMFKGDPEAFADLHQGLCEEWWPEGLSEEDCVYGLATLYFRKDRLPMLLYLKRKKSRNQSTDQLLEELLNADPTLDPDMTWMNMDVSKLMSPHHRPELDPLMKRVSDLYGLSQSLFREHPPGWFERAADLITPQDSDYIHSQLAKNKVRTNADLMALIKRAVDDELLPAARRELRERVTQTDNDLVRALDDISSEEIAAELGLEEEIDRQIQRQLDRLGRIRALKSMGLNGPGRRHNRSRSQIVDNDAHAPPALPSPVMAAPGIPSAANGESQGS
jgi:hypothetical protein